MNHEQFIEKSLLDCYKGDHSLAIKATKEIACRTLSLYKTNDFSCLDGLIDEAMNEIKLKTGLIFCLSNKGTTAKEYSEYADICIATARRRLNRSNLSVCNTEKRPYTFTLIGSSL